MMSNHVRRIALFVIVFSLSATAVFAQASAPAVPVSEFDVNGLKVIVKRRPGAPTVAAGLYFRGGVRNIKPENAGIEAFTLNAAIEGSKGYPRAKLRKETAAVGTVISAGSNYDFSAMVLGSTRQHFESSWKIFADLAMNPTFLPDDVERVRGVFMTGLRSQGDSPEGALELASTNVIYAAHPYAIEPQGTVTTIPKFKAADLAAYHRSMLQTSRMLLVVVGDIDPAFLKTQVESSLGKLPRGDYKADPLPALDFGRPTLEVVSKSLETNYVKGFFAAPSLRDPDYYAMRTAITVLQSNVFQEVRVKRNLSYAPDAELDDHAANTASISVSTTKPNDAIAVMLDEIQKIKLGSVEADELGRMAAYFLTTYYIKQETNAAQVSELAQYEMLGGGWRNSLDFLEKMRKVQPADVKAAANKYMKNIRFVVVGDKDSVDRATFLQGQAKYE